MRRLTIAVGLLCALVQLMTGLHLALVDHSFDPLHHSWVHSHDHGSVHSPAAEHDGADHVQAAEAQEHEEACALSELQLALALPSTLPPPALRPAATLPERSARVPATQPRAGVLAFAPKTSPPA